MEAIGATLLHLLVFAYWLGGDVGAFRSSFLLTDTRAAPVARLAAARLLNDVDMAPRTALVLTVPSGLGLAQAQGWLDLADAIPVAVWALAAAWLVLVWRLHLRHDPPGSILRRIDLALRWGVLGAIAVTLAGTALTDAMPLFLFLKLGLFALALALGLAIRAVLAPLGSLIAPLVAGTPDPAADTALSDMMGRVRLMVVAIWIMLLAAALLGVWKPL